MGLYDFFDEVLNGELSELDIYNFIESKTSNFEPEKVKLLLDELEYYVFIEKEEIESINKWNLNDLIGETNKFKSIDEIPHKELINPLNGKTWKYYNMEQLFYPYHFYNIRKLKKLLISKSDTIKKTPPPDPKTPFTDPKTHELFNYIVDNWDYDKQQKWADIWNVINDTEGYKAPYQNEYRKYVIERFKYTGKFQYDKPKKDGNRDKQKLLELIKEFSKK